jgi:hypothetical protein
MLSSIESSWKQGWSKRINRKLKGVELDELKWKAQRRMYRRPIIYMSRMSSVARKFKMDRRMDRRYRHRFIRLPRVWLQYGSRLCASAPDDPTPWPLVHSIVAFKSNRDTPRQLLQHRMNRSLDGRNHRFIRRLESNTSRDVVINDVTLTSLKTLEWSQLVFCDDFVTILFWSLWWRHICSSVTKLVFPS